MALIHLMLGLPRVGVKPILLATPPKPSYRSLFKRLREKGVKLILSRRRFGGALFWIWLFFAALKSIRDLRINLVHCHGTKEAAVIGLAAKLLRRKIVYTVEGDPILEMAYSPKRYSTLERIVLTSCWRLGLRLADIVVGCSRWMAEHLRKYDVKPRFIHNAIDYERFSTIRMRSEKLRDEILIASIARFEKVKGLDTLIRAAAKVVEENPKVKFILVGGGSMKSELQDLVRSLCLEENVKLLDYTSEVDRILSEASLMVLPSLYEPFGMAAAEALATGLPVIASKTGGLKEIISEGVNGLLFQPGSWRELAEKIISLLRNSEMRGKMVEAARRSAKRFSPEHIASHYVQVYLSALKE